MLPSSSAKVTINKAREYFVRRNAIINSEGIALNKNATVKQLPPKSSYQNTIVSCSECGPYSHFSTEQIMEDQKRRQNQMP